MTLYQPLLCWCFNLVTLKSIYFLKVLFGVFFIISHRDKYITESKLETFEKSVKMIINKTWEIKGNKTATLFSLSWPSLEKKSRQRNADVSCLCVLFSSFWFYLLPVYVFQLPPPSLLPPSLPSSLNRLGGSSLDQACQPGNYLALSNKAATDSNEEWNIKERRRLCSDGSSTRETQRRSESSRSCREAATTLSLPFLHKYHQCRQQSRTCPGSPERVYLYHTARLSVISCWYPWWWLQRNFNKRGSALLSDLTDVLPAACLSKGQRSETHESKCALKPSRAVVIWRSLALLSFGFHVSLKENKRW